MLEINKDSESYNAARMLLAKHFLEVHELILSEQELDDVMHIADLRHAELKRKLLESE